MVMQTGMDAEDRYDRKRIVSGRDMEAWKWGECDFRPEDAKGQAADVRPGDRHLLSVCRMRKRDERRV